MGLGVLEPDTTGHTPGTVLLDQDAAESELVTSGLKHSTGRNANIILTPQPSEDPNDPLNWSQLKKNIVMVIVFFGVIIHGVVPSPLLNAGIVQVSLELNRPVTDIAKLSGWLLIATGCAGPFASAFGRKYGKRPVYIFSSIVGTIGGIVSEVASGYDMLLVGRILHGISVAAYESLAIASIGDIFFVHERAVRVGLMMFLLTAISNGVSIVAGVITANLSWHYNFHILTPFAALQTILVIFYCPETMYRRNAIYDIDTTGSGDNLQKLAKIEASAAQHVEKAEDAADLENSVTHATQSSFEPIPAKKTYFQELAIYNGVFVEDSIIKMVLSSLAIIFNISAFYQIVSTGMIIVWYVAIAILSGVIFASPPYLLDSAKIGYISVGPLIGGFLGSLFPSIISWPFIKFMTRKNKGIFEPEFCLPLVIVGGVIAIAGLVGWGFAIQSFQTVYLVSFTWGVVLFGMSWLATFSTQWALDSFRQHSTEIFVMNMVFKNFFFYGMIQYIIQWYLSQGPVPVAGTMAGITAVMTLLTVPVYIFGKKYRYFWYHHNVIKMLKLETDHTGAE